MWFQKSLHELINVLILFLDEWDSKFVVLRLYSCLQVRMLVLILLLLPQYFGFYVQVVLKVIDQLNHLHYFLVAEFRVIFFDLVEQYRIYLDLLNSLLQLIMHGFWVDFIRWLVIKIAWSRIFFNFGFPFQSMEWLDSLLLSLSPLLQVFLVLNLSYLLHFLVIFLPFLESLV